MLTPHRIGSEPAGVDPVDDPASPELRRKLTTRLLVSAIRRYEETLAAARFMDSAYPKLSEPRHPIDGAEKRERKAWRKLVDQYDADFDAAELALASHIQNLFEELADSEATGRTPFERAIRFEGTLYALQYDVGDYESDSNIVAVIREDRIRDLASEHQRDES